MTRQVQTLALVLLLAAGGAVRLAQDRPAPPPRPAAHSLPVEVTGLTSAGDMPMGGTVDMDVQPMVAK